MTSDFITFDEPELFVPKHEEWAPDERLLPTGSTLLNLALAENPFGGWAKGSIANVIGDSHAGKSFLAWQTLADMANAERYDDYNLFYDDCESALHFDVDKLFGNATERVRYGEDFNSKLVEKCFFRIKDLLKGNKKRVPLKMVYVVDSLDGLSSAEEVAKLESAIGKRDYPDKPRILSEQLKQVAGLVAETQSLVLVVSQTRQNIGVMFGAKKRRSGGDALRFYSTHELWLAVKRHIRVKERDVGTQIRVRISKNKLTGKQREVELPILVDYGIDDIGSMVDWMVEERFWVYKKDKAAEKDKGRVIDDQEEEEKKKKEPRIIKASADLGFDGIREELIGKVEEQGKLDDLRQVVAECWMRVEEGLASNRRPRY
jgi:recombination protein RecA